MVTSSAAARIAILVTGLLAVVPTIASAQDYRHLGWEEVAPGVWFGTTRPDTFQTGNFVIVTLPGGGSLVVDTQNAEFIGREILAKAKEVGRGPVKYVVNTHLHQDHVGGNAAFRRDNPSVEIIAHKNTCTGIQHKTVPRMVDRVPGMAKGLEGMQAARAKLTEGDKAATGLDRRSDLPTSRSSQRDVRRTAPLERGTCVSDGTVVIFSNAKEKLT
jgi:glyoxylase-like metal-dependent hydrolase (beta-lactamase superfamily II)